MNKFLVVLAALILLAGVYFLFVQGQTQREEQVNNNDQPNGEDRPATTTDENNDDDEPLPQGSATVVRTVSTSNKVVVLTFDAGADAGFTSAILDTLRDENIKASFGMTGKWAEANPALVRRIADEGHDFINHTWSHDSFTGFSTNDSPLTREQRFDELTRTEDLIKSLTGVSTKPFFRPPYGDYDAGVNRDLYAQGYTYNIMWTVDSLGWKGISKEEITRRVVDGSVPGAIHLMHVGEQSQDAAALPAIISELKAKGYTFARISDLL